MGQPNILFLFTDDQRLTTLGALNNPEIRTPNLDRLVRSGTVFTRPYIMGSTVGAVCICSRSMLLTGRSLFRSPRDPQHGDGLALWPETLRQAGYTTFATGKWHNGPQAFARCFSSGADIFFGGMSDHLKVPVHQFNPHGNYPREAARLGGKFSTELFSDAAIRFLETYEAQAPFFLYVSYTAPHDPRMAPREFAEMYRPENIALPENFMPRHPFDNGELGIRDEQLAPFPRTPEVIRRHIADYYAMITHADFHMGRILEALERTGHERNTIIVFAGDNGLALGQHGLMGKQSLYEHSLSVPLIFAGPGIPAGRRCDALVYLHDVFPTTCDLAGIPTPQTVESVSLVPILRGEKPPVREHIFGAYKDLQRCLIGQRWKLIRYPQVGVTQLFDLQADPWELNNLADDPAHADTLLALDQRLRDHQRQLSDPLPLPPL